MLLFLLDRPFVSQFLKETLVHGQWPVVSTEASRQLLKDEAVEWVSEESIHAQFTAGGTPRLYTNSENALTWVKEHLPHSHFARLSTLFKDKYQTRQLLANHYPDLRVHQYHRDELLTLDVDRLPVPGVVKPSVGFFSIGVHVVQRRQDWSQALETLHRQLSLLDDEAHYPDSVCDPLTVIVEPYISGEEYAIDAYFDDEGHPVVLNILHHRFSSAADVRDRCYSTSPSLIQSLLPSVQQFLTDLGNAAQLKGFPLHVEVRQDPASGRMVPIEVNPLRFGGWCATDVVAFHAYEVNVYEAYMTQRHLNWETHLQAMADDQVSVIILDPPPGLDLTQVKRFDYEALCDRFQTVLELRPVDWNQYPVFGFLFVRTDQAHLQELEDILHDDLMAFIELKETAAYPGSV